MMNKVIMYLTLEDLREQDRTGLEWGQADDRVHRAGGRSSFQVKSGHVSVR